MPRVASSYAVKGKGIGWPDHSKTVSSAITRSGIRLKYSESLKIGLLTFLAVPPGYPFPYFVDPLAPGASQNIIDAETGHDTGFTIPEGYYGTILELIAKSNQDISAWIVFDTLNCGCLWQLAGGDTLYEHEVVPLSTSMLDPAAAAAHNLNFFVTNEGGADLIGGATVIILLEKAGTKPLPTVKDIKCKHCGNIQTVPVETTQVICPKCGKLTIYYSLAKYRGS